MRPTCNQVAVGRHSKVRNLIRIALAISVGGSLVLAASAPGSAAVAKPVISTTSLSSVVVGNAYAQTLHGTGGVAPYDWSVITGTLPPGLSLNTRSGEITGTAKSVYAKAFTVKLTDSERPAVSVTKQFTIKVLAPTVTTKSLHAGTIGWPYLAAATSSGGVAPLSWSVSTGSLPAGLALNSHTGEISGTPTAGVSKTFTLAVMDSEPTPAKATKQFTIAVPKLAITTSALPTSVVGVAFSQQLATNGGVAPFRWSINAGTLPHGLSLDSGTGTITGTSTSLSSGSVTFSVSDSAPTPNTVTKSLSVKSVVFGVTSTPVFRSVKGIPYSTHLTAAGGIRPYTWSGTVPAGFSLNSSTGQISGTPTKTGAFAFSVKVTDSTGRGLSRPTSQPAQQTPVPTATATQPLSASQSDSMAVVPIAITTTTAPIVHLAEQYSTSLQASGGTSPYTWSLVGGHLPQGLTLDPSTGAIIGRPLSAGSPSIVVTVTDSASTPASDTEEVAIPTEPAISWAPAIGNAGAPSSASLPQGSSIPDISCPEVGFCFTVGSAFLETLAGGIWSTAPLPAPADADPSKLIEPFRITCLSRSFCAFVGTYTPLGSTHTRPYAAMLQNGAWTAAQLPLPADNIDGAAYQMGGPWVTDIACSSPTNCFGTGFYSSTGAFGAAKFLFERYQNGSWTSSAGAVPSDVSADDTSFALNASCDPAGTCYAAGSYRTIDGFLEGFIASGGLGTWTAVRVPLPADAAPDSPQNPGVQFNDLTCPAAGTCTAVGEYSVEHANTSGSVSTDFEPLVESLKDGTWQASTPSAASPSGTGALNSVSCPTKDQCFAVGHTYDATGSHGLIDTLTDGQSAPESIGLDLTQVACGSSTSCEVVGSAPGSQSNWSTGTLFIMAQGNWNQVSLGAFQPLRVSAPAAGTYGFVGYTVSGADFISNGSSRMTP